MRTPLRPNQTDRLSAFSYFITLSCEDKSISVVNGALNTMTSQHADPTTAAAAAAAAAATYATTSIKFRAYPLIDSTRTV